ALGDVQPSAVAVEAPGAPAATTAAALDTPSAREGGYRLPVGALVDGDGHVTVDLESLRRHTAIFAGSGSGKTVLIRRRVAECALRGVSAIVLDPNNDLARLGDPWPTAPDTWGAHDADRATEYLRSTDVVVWTPRRESGRPLSFQPLPEFADILDDP